MRSFYKVFAAAVCAIAFFSLSPCACATDEVAFIVDTNLYSSCQAKILRYKADVETWFPVHLRVCSEANFETYTPAQIRTYIINQYNTYGIKGVVLVGQINYPLWRNYAPGADDKGINSYYYEDLDGTFSDTTGDGYDDLHDWGDRIGPEIWCCWMRPPASSQTSSLNAFLDKTHSYYVGDIAFNHRALVTAHADYDNNIRSGFQMVAKLQPLYGSNIDIDGEGTDLVYASDQISMLNANKYEIYDPMGHANSTLQQWDSGYVYSSTVSALTGGAIMTFIYGCHSAAFNEAPSSNLAQLYAFGSSIGQAASGTSWNYGTEGKWYIYEELARGGYLGKAWFNMECIKNNPPYMKERYGETFDTDRHLWGDTLIGNPFVYANFSPPTGKSLKDIRGVTDGKSVIISDAVLTADFNGESYVWQKDRACGIKVLADTTAAPGSLVRVTGVLDTENGERVVRYADIKTGTGTGTTKPMIVSGKALSGKTGVGGLQNMGLLVKVAGQIRSSGTGWFVLDDGSQVTTANGTKGIKVRCDGITPPTTGFRAVTGISTTELVNGVNYPVVRVRFATDIRNS
jgi:hypothetical protein